MRIYKHQYFKQWAKSENITDAALKEAVNEINNGLYDANLGGGLFKKRVAMPGKGKRGSYRTILAFRQEEKAFFVYGYAKNSKENLDPKETLVFKQLARELLNVDENVLRKMIKMGSLIEVK